MSETKMPATEASQADERELVSYEFAFHVLPTVAEGEVTKIFDEIKNQITKVGGELTGEESPKRFDLAYEIVKHLEGKNRKFGSAYFGWVRFRAESAQMDSLKETFDATKELLRFILIKLSKVEEQTPFRFHDSIVNKQVRVIEGEDSVVEEVVAEVESKEEVVAEAEDDKEEKEAV